MERWVMLRKGADFAGIGKKFQISPRLACLIRNRDVVGEEAIGQYLNGTIGDLCDGMLMKDMDKAVEILREKLEEGKRLRVIGDYDIDGVNATYILLEGLKRLGADADYDIPDRMTDGYGLNIHLVQRAYDDGVDTVLTCDNGIAAAEEIAFGKDMGMTVIVTDHHEVPFEEWGGKKQYLLPPADAVVDPKRPDCEYPFPHLCGAAVAYKLMEALWESMGRDSEDLDDLIENVAIATVGDVMDLKGENRIFVKEGLQMLERTRNPGLRSLIECTGLADKTISAYHIGFVLGPCLNASGRLDTAKRALRLLEAKTRKEADQLAWDLKALNDSRKEMTEKAVKEAELMVEASALKEDRVLVIYLPDCHESLAGIVAGRIRERYYKPAFVLTNASEGLKGSGRSIEAYSMYEELSRCKDLLMRFGGHRQAAGLSMKRENLESFRKMINDHCTLTPQDLTEKVVIDMEMPFSCVTEGLIRELALLEPFGKGNTKPVFAARNVRLMDMRVMGRKKNVLKMRAVDANGNTVEAVYFGDVENLSGRKDTLLSITYYPTLNEYMGQATPQIVITHYQTA
ncbi:single-stranded-DNA-specific exonuclease RecJ [Merdimonas faecis]|uniref:Single-stranded-DNA-specific exonuclease RecJ n=1 Tax=Merdimonas faecis TaxID=1653435 RepID=A0A9D3AIY2_9FIRM|nr:single-stranded-DNA-specific exonuclease RecJ [Merdimonas faecis]HJH49487.1 single-stranded-DNA-specific exonuclease RecJ [Merdimonas faecis]